MGLPSSDQRAVLRALRPILTHRLSSGEVRTICFDVGIDYDDLSGGTKPAKIVALLEYLEDRQVLPALLDWLAAQRPDIDLQRLTPAPAGVGSPEPVRGDALPSPQARTGPIRDRWALLVGINSYIDPAFPALRFCVDDVLDLRDALQAAGYTVVALYDDVAEERLLPTRENVEAELARICEVAGRDDLIWVHFSCHGKVVGGKPVLVTRESRAPTLAERALSLVEVERRLRTSAARRLVLTLDACHTGVDMGRDVADPEFIRNAYELAEGFALLAASTSQQVAQEWREKARGVFTHFLLQGLAGEADRGQRQFVTVNDLVTHTLDGLRRWNVEHGGLLQEPTARFEGMGDIILVDRRSADR